MGDIGGARSAFRTVAEIDNHQPPSQSVLNRYAGFVFAELLIEELDYEGAIRLSSAAQNWADHEGLPLAAGLHSVAIAKAMLCRVGSLESESRLAKVCTQAIKQLIAAGEVQHVPRALLVRACLRALQHQPDLARADLDEAWQIAEYGPMRLHIVDIYLHRARLFHDKEELKRARVVIEQCGYWRRKHELEAAEEDAKQWS
jgi:hypothetical protein